jgi:pimeloyl-ACP methyl ester carboxylesterase
VSVSASGTASALVASRERDLSLDALCDLALGAAIPAAVFGVAARGLGVPFAGPLTVMGLLAGMVPVLGRVLWLTLVALLAVLDTNGTSAILIVALILAGTGLTERGARRLVRRWSGGPRAHLVRILMLLVGFAGAGLAGVVVALALSPRRRSARTLLRRRWAVGAVAGPLLLLLAAAPALGFPAQEPDRVLPAADVPPGLTGSPKTVVLFVHGLGEASGRRGDFDAVFDPLRESFGPDAVHEASYYQDLSDRKPHTRECVSSGSTLRAPQVPQDLQGMPVDLQTRDEGKCDSESDLGLNVLSLSAQVHDLRVKTGHRVILVGYSMGGTIVRGLITLSALRHDEILRDDVDSIVLLHAVTQGSVLARDGGRIASLPVVGDLASDLFAGTIADPSRPAFTQLAPRSPFHRWLAAHAADVPPLPTFVTYGAITVAGESCVLDVYVCLTTGRSQVGDGAVDPGPETATTLPVGGGAPYLPQGPGPQSWE